jgi:hypothetical protein
VSCLFGDGCSGCQRRPISADWREELRSRSYPDLALRGHTDHLDRPILISQWRCMMFKAIFGFLGLLIALAIFTSLAKTQLAAIGQMGQTAARVLSPSGGDDKTADANVGRAAGRAVGGARLDGFAATAGADVPSAQQQSQGTQQSVIGRTDEAWRQSEQRYKRADP